MNVGNDSEMIFAMTVCRYVFVKSAKAVTVCPMPPAGAWSTGSALISAQTPSGS